LRSAALVLSACYRGLGKLAPELRLSSTASSEASSIQSLGPDVALAKVRGSFVLRWLTADDVGADVGGPSESSARDPSPLEAEVEAETQVVRDTVAPWRPTEFEAVDTIQEAPRNHGRVALMRSLERGGRFVAVKQMPNTWVTESFGEFTRRWPRSSERPWLDMALVRYLHGRGYGYICEPLGVYRDGCSTYVAAEYATEGDLFLWMSRGPSSGVERESMLRPIIRQLFEAVRHLHEFGVVHRDLSLENVLVTDKTESSPSVKLVDFGMASLNRACHGVCGKCSYVAPEQYLHVEYDGFLCDSFALGVALFSVATQAYPWQTTRAGHCRQFDYIASHGLRAFIARRKLGGFSLRLADVLSPSLVDLAEASMHMHPELRACLGERCFESGAEEEPFVAAELGPPRASVLDFAWLREP